MRQTACHGCLCTGKKKTKLSADCNLKAPTSFSNLDGSIMTKSQQLFTGVLLFRFTFMWLEYRLVSCGFVIPHFPRVVTITLMKLSLFAILRVGMTSVSCSVINRWSCPETENMLIMNDESDTPTHFSIFLTHLLSAVCYCSAQLQRLSFTSLGFFKVIND